ncbi:CBM21 domain-containing protein [Mycena chlorophos]|uniref:CBM21 domain-containing protein n=1 Tax=Mycena chlorophos TaxID=658473 RepID=A0A8H6TQR5_MYCCL|nr:CBM21 domain-containing protein [Mycena chlorophos]
MIATLAMSPSIDANSASAPLPILPRRSPSASRVSFPSMTPAKASSSVSLVLQQATPPSDDESSSTSPTGTSAVILMRPKRSRGTTTHPVPLLAPCCIPPGAGSLRALSMSSIPALSPPPTPKFATDETPRIIRKKSGEPLKSSLKSSTPRVRGSLEVVINGGTATSSKSVPTTPTGSLRVHFNSQLEQVKLFLAEQKPLAVSRDGSPTDDTSGTEEFPDFIFGRDSEDEGTLEMQVEVPRPVGELDVKLQTFALTDDRTGVAGTIAVRNLAFDKRVAVRFTLDDWQTTSEVIARYQESMPGGMVDIFAFNIRLNDVLARIDGKRMAVAVRYNAAGREMWDNNGGKNYLATFKRVRSEAAKARTGQAAADLRNRLEHVVKTQDRQDPPPIALRNSASQNRSATVGFRAGGSLASRYDFNASSRAPWRPHQRAQSHPTLDSPSPPNTVPWPPQKPRATLALGSPRDVSDDVHPRLSAPYVPSSDTENHPFALPKRQHQRGYFDVPLRETGSMRRTPPGTPRSGGVMPLGSPGGRYNSFPPLDPRGLGLGLELPIPTREGSNSEDSTPSFVGSSDSGSGTSGTTSPVSPPDLLAVEARLGGLDMATSPSTPSTYHNFLDKFCFYTGVSPLESPSIPRTQSASSVEELLSVVSASPQLQALVDSSRGDETSPISTPTSTTPRNSSFDTLEAATLSSPIPTVSVVLASPEPSTIPRTVAA